MVEEETPDGGPLQPQQPFIMHLTIYKLLKNVTSSKGVPGVKMLDWQGLNAHWNPFIVDPSILENPSLLNLLGLTHLL